MINDLRIDNFDGGLGPSHVDQGAEMQHGEDGAHMEQQGEEARFQHPLGVALHENQLFVADTFNHLIRVIDLPSKKVTTWLGTGKSDAGTEDAIGFFEPGGISIAGDMLYIADTNHHRIVAADIKTKKVRVLDVQLPTTQPDQSTRPG